MDDYPFPAHLRPGFGAPVPLIHTIRADCFGTRSFASIGGLMTLGSAIAGVTGPLLAGWLYDILGSYHLASTLFAILCRLAVPVMMFTQVTPLRARATAPDSIPNGS